MDLGLKTRVVRGGDLRISNMIRVWWTPGCDIITELRLYRGPLIDLFPDGAQVATFATNVQMTIDNGDRYDVVHQTDRTGT